MAPIYPGFFLRGRHVGELRQQADVLVSENLGIASQEWNFEDPRRGDNQLIRRVAMEIARKLAGFDYDCGSEGKSRTAGNETAYSNHSATGRSTSSFPI